MNDDMSNNGPDVDFPAREATEPRGLYSRKALHMNILLTIVIADPGKNVPSEDVGGGNSEVAESSVSSHCEYYPMLARGACLLIARVQSTTT